VLTLIMRPAALHGARLSVHLAHDSRPCRHVAHDGMVMIRVAMERAKQLIFARPADTPYRRDHLAAKTARGPAAGARRAEGRAASTLEPKRGCRIRTRCPPCVEAVRSSAGGAAAGGGSGCISRSDFGGASANRKYRIGERLRYALPPFRIRPASVAWLRTPAAGVVVTR